MADEDQEAEATGADGAGDADASAGSGKKKLILAIIGVLLLIGISVGGTLAALKFLSPPAPEVTAEGETPVEEEEDPLPKPAIYYPIKPAIITTFKVKGRQRYLQASITLLTREPDVVPAIELHMPMIRNALNLIISGQVYEEIQTAEGKELMRQLVLDELQKILEKEIGKPGVEEVLFTNIVMQ